MLIIILFILVLTSCGIEESPNNQAEAETIRLEGGDYGYPSPYAHYPRGPGGYKMNLIFDSLLERDKDGLIPWLAKDYEISDDGREYLFSIREGVKWQDGETLTAEDVKFSFEYNSYNPMVWSRIQADDIENVEIKDDNQILITVAETNAALLYDLGRLRIIPKHIWEDVDNPREFTQSEAVIGTGPYRLDNYNQEHGTYRFVAFEDFWGATQNLEAIEFIPVSDNIMSFERGDIDLTRIGSDLLSRYQDNDEVEVVQRPAFWGYRLLFNQTDNPELRDKKLRQAISYALDLEDIINRDARGAGLTGSPGVLPPDHIMYNPDVKQYNHNLVQAEKLLSEIGYKEENEVGIRYNEAGKKLNFTISVNNDEIRLAEILKEQLAELGIGLEVQSAERSTHDVRIKNDEYQLAIYGHGAWGEDADYLRSRFMASNDESDFIPDISSAGYENHNLNQLLEEQRLELNQESRQEILFAIQDILAEDVAEIPIYYTAGYTAYNSDKYNDWIFMFDHHSLTHNKLSYLKRSEK